MRSLALLWFRLAQSRRLRTLRGGAALSRALLCRRARARPRVGRRDRPPHASFAIAAGDTRPAPEEIRKGVHRSWAPAGIGGVGGGTGTGDCTIGLSRGRSTGNAASRQRGGGARRGQPQPHPTLKAPERRGRDGHSRIPQSLLCCRIAVLRQRDQPEAPVEVVLQQRGAGPGMVGDVPDARQFLGRNLRPRTLQKGLYRPTVDPAALLWIQGLKVLLIELAIHGIHARDAVELMGERGRSRRCGARGVAVEGPCRGGMAAAAPLVGNARARARRAAAALHGLDQRRVVDVPEGRQVSKRPSQKPRVGRNAPLRHRQEPQGPEEIVPRQRGVRLALVCEVPYHCQGLLLHRRACPHQELLDIRRGDVAVRRVGPSEGVEGVEEGLLVP
mmetsp:Transcript_7922/g.19436  ORF Transcript_7922/g.19436 Transcript_7922/m.19436 type:complete len:388 (-) Transcript_7922:85-1248(-)